MAEDRPRPALDDPNAYVLYRYYPSQVAAIVFVILFALTTILHIFQLIKKRTWYFIPLVVGGLCKYHIISPDNEHVLTLFVQLKPLGSSDEFFRRTISGPSVLLSCNPS